MRDRLALIVVLVAAAMALVACGSSKSSSTSTSAASTSSTNGAPARAAATASGNGIGAKSANEILAQATSAIGAVRSVQVTGTVRGGPSMTITLNLGLVAGKGATGSMSENGRSFRLISVGNDVYINGSARFWRSFGGSAAVALLQGRWLKAPATSGAFASFGSLTNLHKLITDLLSGHGALSKGATGTADGRSVIALNDTSRHGTLYVATTGKPYPIAIVKTGTRAGRIDFSRFDEPVSLAPPARSIDITKLHVK